jgi:threonine aldolase
MGTDEELAERRRELRDRSRVLYGGGSPDAAEELRATAEWCVEQGVSQDVYGAGDFIEGFEAKVAGLFGMEAGRFLPSGTMAQGIAMRLWCGPGGHFGMHPTCHLELHEERGYLHLFGLRATLIGPRHRPMLSGDLEAVKEALDVVIVELPTRENGGQLPEWDELVELSETVRSRGTTLHLDGARIWEARAGYDRPFDEIGVLFDSIYVSFYKGIGALPGSMLLGSRPWIDEAVVWQRRMGGNLYTLLPSAASAARRLDDRIEAMSGHRRRALALAEALADVDGVRVIPDPPHVNMMHVELDLGSDEAMAARDRVAEETGLWLFEGVKPLDAPGRVTFELSVGEAAMAVTDEEVGEAVCLLFSS